MKKFKKHMSNTSAIANAAKVPKIQDIAIIKRPTEIEEGVAKARNAID